MRPHPLARLHTHHENPNDTTLMPPSRHRLQRGAIKLHVVHLNLRAVRIALSPPHRLHRNPPSCLTLRRTFSPSHRLPSHIKSVNRFPSHISLDDVNGFEGGRGSRPLVLCDGVKHLRPKTYDRNTHSISACDGICKATSAYDGARATEAPSLVFRATDGIRLRVVCDGSEPDGPDVRLSPRNPPRAFAYSEAVPIVSPAPHRSFTLYDTHHERVHG